MRFTVIIGLLALAGAGAALATAKLRPVPSDEMQVVYIHYAPSENLERVDVELIDSARVSIDMAAYVLTDRPVIEALQRAGARGVRIRIWRDPEMAARVGLADIAAHVAPDDAQIALREKPAGPLMHLKSYCVDGAILRTGSANFSRSGLLDQDNDLVVLRSYAACAAFEARFGAAWGN